MKYSIVITSYNRAWCIERAIISAFLFLKKAHFDGEIIIVDDGSKDQTVKVACDTITSFKDLPKNTFKVFEFSENRGVCAAKNFGANSAGGEWVIFLDSDDELIADNYEQMNQILDNFKKYPAHFFGTIDESFIHKVVVDDVIFLDINRLVISGTNGRDAAPVIRSEVKKLFPYNEDIRGYEGLAYLRIAKKFGKIPLHGQAIIQVHTTHDDRLSSKSGQKKRSSDLARGHRIALIEHWGVFCWTSRAKMILRYLKAISLSQRI